MATRPNPEPTPPPASAAKRVRYSDVVPTFPVLKKEDVDFPFMVKEIGRFKGRFSKDPDDKSFRLTCINPDTGEMFLILLGDNPVRRERMAHLQSALDEGYQIGPVTLTRTALGDPTRADPWDLTDAGEDDES